MSQRMARQMQRPAFERRAAKSQACPPRAGFVTADHEPAHHGQQELNSIRGRYLHDRRAESFRTFWIFVDAVHQIAVFYVCRQKLLNLHLYEF